MYVNIFSLLKVKETWSHVTCLQPTFLFKDQCEYHEIDFIQAGCLQQGMDHLLFGSEQYFFNEYFFWSSLLPNSLIQ